MFRKIQAFRILYSYTVRKAHAETTPMINNIRLLQQKNSNYYSNMPKKEIATFEEVRAAKDNKNLIIIDVREPSELKETGILPNSINIPLGDLENALKMPKSDFKNLYGHPKPESNFHIIFSCKLGKRSEAARQIALKLGYSNVQNYSGGWQEWEQKIKQ